MGAGQPRLGQSLPCHKPAAQNCVHDLEQWAVCGCYWCCCCFRRGRACRRGHWAVASAQPGTGCTLTIVARNEYLFRNFTPILCLTRKWCSLVAQGRSGWWTEHCHPWFPRHGRGAVGPACSCCPQAQLHRRREYTEKAFACQFVVLAGQSRCAKSHLALYNSSRF